MKTLEPNRHGAGPRGLARGQQGEVRGQEWVRMSVERDELRDNNEQRHAPRDHDHDLGSAGGAFEAEWPADGVVALHGDAA